MEKLKVILRPHGKSNFAQTMQKLAESAEKLAIQMQVHHKYYFIVVYEDFFEASDDNTGYAIEAGYLPINGLLLAVGVSKENIDAHQVGKKGFINSYSAATALADDTALTLRAKYVTQIGNHFTNFEASTAFGDDTAYGVAADLYIDPTLSVGVTINDADIEDFDTVFGVRAQKFFTPAICSRNLFH